MRTIEEFFKVASDMGLYTRMNTKDHTFHIYGGRYVGCLSMEVLRCCRDADEIKATIKRVAHVVGAAVED